MSPTPEQRTIVRRAVLRAVLASRAMNEPPEVAASRIMRLPEIAALVDLMPPPAPTGSADRFGPLPRTDRSPAHG